MTNFETPFEEPNRGKNERDKRLSNDEIKELLNEYGDKGLSVDGEYFVVKKEDNTETRFHLWKKIPHVIGKDESENPILEAKKIEDHIREHLGLSEEKTEEESEEGGGEKEII